MAEKHLKTVKPRRRLLTCVAYCAFVTTAVLLSVLLLAILPNEIVKYSPHGLFFRVFVAVLLVVAGLTYQAAIVKLKRLPRQDDPLQPDLTVLDEHRLAACIAGRERASSRYGDPATLLLLLDSVVCPSRHLVRVVETAVLQEGRTSHTVLREVLLPTLTGVLQGDSSPRDVPATDGMSPTTGAGTERGKATESAPSARLLLPVQRGRKGQILDEFSFTLDGKVSPVLGYAENAAVSAVMVREMFLTCYEILTLTPADAELLNSITLLIAEAEPDHGAARLQGIESQLSVRLESARAGVANSTPDLYDRAMRIHELESSHAALVSLVEYLANDRYTFAELNVDFGSRHLLEVAYSQRRLDYVGAFINRFRLALGLSVQQYRFEVPLAVEAASYHFRCSAPEGAYMHQARHHFQEAEGSGASVSTDVDRGGVPTLTFSPTHGTGIVHFYARHIADRAVSVSKPNNGQPVSKRSLGLVLDVQFRPLPPGLLAPIFLLSGYLALVTLAVAWKHNQIFVSGGHGGSTAALGVVFGIPAIMSGWLASRFDAKALKVAGLVTMSELLGLLVNAGLAVGVIALKSSGVLPNDEQTLPLFTWLVHVQHPVWTVVTISCVTHALICLGDLCVRHIAYMRVLMGAR